MKRCGLRRALTFVLAVATGALLAGPPSRSAVNAVFGGRVFQSDGVSPRPGVVVALLDTDSGQLFRSRPTNDEGTFKIDSAPAGSYTLLTEAGEGAFLADEPIELSGGPNRPLALTLSSTLPVSTLAPAQANQGPSLLVSWIVAGSIIAAALWALDEWSDDVEETPSDF